MKFLKIVSLTVIVLGLVAWGLIFMAVDSHREMRRHIEEFDAKVQKESAHERNYQEMVMLTGQVRIIKEEIDAHNKYIEKLDTSNYDLTKAAVEKSMKLSTDLYDLTQRYEDVAEDLGCAYPGSINIPRPNGDTVTLPCHL